MSNTEGSKIVSVRAPKVARMEVPIIGVGGYIPHRLDEATARAAQKVDEDGKSIKGTAPRKERNLDVEYEACFYRDRNGDYAIPGSAFKSALKTAAIAVEGLDGTTVKRHVRILEEMCKLEYDEVVRREDAVRQGGKTRAPDIRHRPEFLGWSTKITVQFDMEVMPKQAVLNLLARAGFTVGVGDWRPDKGGDHGTFMIGESNVEA